ncbi:MAG TPA: NAD(P)H-dependent oxidoreductase [Candidatus Saccharimonadales bacterium]|nr:NAD(P)H-dependent oxidoreductase [Candidatus Saccharimonadales bacterium]
MAKIAIIVGSTRESRVTDKLATWVAKEAANKAETEVLDLRDYPLPFFDEAMPPRYNPHRELSADVEKWVDKIAEFEGYIIVTPEYNRSMAGVLKNAFDNLGNEIADKPVALVAHGSAGGAQAVASLRITLPGNGAVTLPDALFFTDQVGQAIDQEGVLKAELQEGPYSPQASLANLIDSLVKYSDALKTVRA